MSVRIIKGDVREILHELPADIFDCICTSPPYYGLRDYGTATWEGGDLACDHKMPIGQRQDVGRAQIDGFHGSTTTSELSERNYKNVCGKCGARRIDAQIGLEPTLDAYLETMVAVCRELRRVLKPSGVFFLNVGNSYAGHNSPGYRAGNELKNGGAGNKNGIGYVAGLKPKDLCLVPERLGIALQADGWWVRSHIIWAKKNCMPESATDRPTSAHETIWMLTKSARYFWDAEAVKEEAAPYRSTNYEYSESSASGGLRGSGGFKDWRPDNGRNLRNVWHIASQPFPGAHFATMPPEIAERCIKAGSSERGCCAVCGAPWVRVTDGASFYQGDDGTRTRKSNQIGNGHGGSGRGPKNNLGASIQQTIGWQRSCKCPIKPGLNRVPARVLDPFAGAGTTGLVADRLGRDCTLIDLNTEYADMALNRIRDDAPLFAEVAAE